MKYIDMHCDSVTAGCNLRGDTALSSCCVNARKLAEADCFAQCFAIFTEGKNAAGDFEKFSAFYFAMLAQNPSLTPAYCLSDLKNAENAGKIAAILTVENAGFLKDVSGFSRLKEMGVKMLSLVWNFPNKFARPNFCGDEKFLRKRESRGLTKEGKQAVRELNRLGIIIDVSHLSDGGVEDVLNISKKPIVASHSDACAVTRVSRNLTDSQLKKIADGGGIVGLNFSKTFLGGDSFSRVLAHYRHMANVAGEDCPAFGSDFDGIARYPRLADCTAMPALISYFEKHGVKGGALEKLCYGNFLRVFKDVVG